MSFYLHAPEIDLPFFLRCLKCPFRNFLRPLSRVLEAIHRAACVPACVVCVYMHMCVCVCVCVCVCGQTYTTRYRKRFYALTNLQSRAGVFKFRERLKFHSKTYKHTQIALVSMTMTNAPAARQNTYIHSYTHIHTQYK